MRCCALLAFHTIFMFHYCNAGILTEPRSRWNTHARPEFLGVIGVG